MSDANQAANPQNDSNVHYHDGVACHHDHGPSATPFVNPQKNLGRNDPCHCGSGSKYKKCCLSK